MLPSRRFLRFEVTLAQKWGREISGPLVFLPRQINDRVRARCASPAYIWLTAFRPTGCCRFSQALPTASAATPLNVLAILLERMGTPANPMLAE
jgi:hypothetical protein